MAMTPQEQKEIRDKFLEKMLGGGSASAAAPAATDPDLLAVLREIRDNTGRIARALEDRQGSGT